MSKYVDLFLFEGCQKDVVFLLDSSSSLTPEQFATNLMFVNSIVETLFDMQSQFAVVSYNENPYIFMTFEDQQTSKAQLKNEVRLSFYYPVISPGTTRADQFY